MYQAPFPASTTGCTCPAGPHRSMTLIQRITWHPLYPANCQTCGVPLARRRALLFFGWVPATTLIFMLLSFLFWPNFVDVFIEYLHIWAPVIFSLQLISAWLEFRYDPITVKPAGKR
jgi:hypothetical protein